LNGFRLSSRVHSKHEDWSCTDKETCHLTYNKILETVVKGDYFCTNSSQADSHVNCLKTSDASETHSISILRESELTTFDCFHCFHSERLIGETEALFHVNYHAAMWRMMQILYRIMGFDENI
jgi:hypothetical protein